MNKNIVAKVVKRIVIGGVIYLTMDLYYQMGKGRMLRLQMEHGYDAKEIYDFLETNGTTKYETIRCKIIKFFANPKGD